MPLTRATVSVTLDVDLDTLGLPVDAPDAARRELLQERVAQAVCEALGATEAPRLSARPH